MNDLPILQKRNAGNLFERLALGVVHDGVVEFLAADEINFRAVAQRLLRQHAHVRSDKRNFDLGIGLLDGLRDPHVAWKARRRREEDEKFISLGDLNRLFRGNVMRRRIQQPRPFNHPGRISQPNRIPIGLDFTRSRPARTGAAVEALKRRWIQK